jgi:hypothetical protein
MHVRAAWPHSVPAVAECLPGVGNASHGFTPPARNLRAPDNEGIGAVTLRAFASPRRRHARGAGASLRQRQGLDDAAAKIASGRLYGSIPAAVDAAPKRTAEQVRTAGRGYLSFAIGNAGLFRLRFSSSLIDDPRYQQKPSGRA